MKAGLARRIWTATAIFLLLVGFGAAANTDPYHGEYLSLWFVCMALVSFPLGLVLMVLVYLALQAIESVVFPPQTHFSLIASVCFVWVAAVAGALVQYLVIKKIRLRRVHET